MDRMIGQLDCQGNRHHPDAYKHEQLCLFLH